jgi:tripartite motif-containing protein 2/3
LFCCRDDVGLKMASPTPSLDSLTGVNSLGSLIDQNDYHSLSNSPATASPTASVSSTFSGNGAQYLTKCFICDDIYTNPKVLHCFHTFCKDCLECKQEYPNKIVCPRCQVETILGSRGVADLVSDFSVNNIIEQQNQNPSFCTSCKSRTSFAVSRCVDCKSYLCDNCTMAHQFMHCFEGHRVHTLSQENGEKEDIKTGLGLTNGEKEQGCPRHKTSVLKYFCRTCNVPVCKECTLFDHQSPAHDCEHISEAGPKQIELMTQAVQEGKNKATDLRNMVKTLEHTAQRLQVQYHKAQNEINDTFQFYRSMLEERKQDLLKELDGVFNAKQMGISVMGQKAQDTVEKIYQVCEFIERLVKCSSVSECLLFKKFMDSRLQALTCYTPDPSVQQACDLEFVSNYQAIQVGVRNTFGYVRSSAEVIGTSKQPPIARPTGTNGTITMNGSSPVNGCLNGGSLHSAVNGVTLNGALNGVLERPYSNGLSTSTSTSQYESNIISKRFSSANSLGPFSTSISDLGLNGINHYEKWSSGGSDIFQNGGSEYMSTLSLSSQGDPMLDLSSKFLSSTSIFPPKSQIKRQKMIYHCKFGEFGVLEGQFTEPSGVAVNAQNDIIVADTNNHRIQIFDKEGRFKFQFGECGKRDGQLLYPNRVAVVKTSGDIIVTERSPTHQIQIYNQYGQFVRKFGANILQHPRGVTVDNKGRIVVVECKVMRVIIFDQAGNVLQKFGCSKHLEFPNGVVVNDKQEIFISDNRAHCVKVFNYEGVFLRQIGSEGVTNYPIGVGINSAGEILIADNHNNFNLTIFTQDGQLVSALESKVKHAQCFDVALMDDGSVVLASKDYRLYIYRYVQVPPIGL